MWGLDYKTARIFAWVKNVHASGQRKVWSEDKTGDLDSGETRKRRHTRHGQRVSCANITSAPRALQNQF